MFSESELAAMHAAGVAPPTISEAMRTYCLLRYILVFAWFAYTALVLWWMLEGGKAAQWRNAINKFAPNRFMAVVYYYLLIVGLLTLLRLPLSFYSGYILDHQFGLSHELMITWITDLLKAKIVDVAVSGPALFLAFWLIDTFPKKWPLPLWGCLTALIAAGIFFTPLVIDPLYNKFEPMPASRLKSAIHELTNRAGLDSPPIYVVDKSRQTAKLNAYVTGIAHSARVVIWDNTLQKLPPDQLLSIVGHELGHYVLNHIYTGLLLSSGGLLLGLLIVARLKDRLLAALPQRWEITGSTDLAVIPLLLLCATIIGFVGAPIENSIARTMEQEADAYGLQLTGNGPAMARTFVALSQENLSEPDPPAFIQFWFFSHPSLRQRIDFALGIER